MMLDDSYKCLRWLGERRFFLPDMKRIFSLSFIQHLFLHRSMEWDLIEKQFEVSLGQIFHHTIVPMDHDKNVVELLHGSLEAEYPVVRLPIR